MLKVSLELGYCYEDGGKEAFVVAVQDRRGDVSGVCHSVDYLHRMRDEKVLVRGGSMSWWRKVSGSEKADADCGSRKIKRRGE